MNALKERQAIAGRNEIDQLYNFPMIAEPLAL